MKSHLSKNHFKLISWIYRTSLIKNRKYAIMNWWNIYCHTLISYNINIWRVESFQNRKDILGSNDKLTFDQENKFSMQSCKMYLLRKSNEENSILKWKVIVSWEQSFLNIAKTYKKYMEHTLKMITHEKRYNFSVYMHHIGLLCNNEM